jgi:hypothetical protein
VGHQQRRAIRERGTGQWLQAAQIPLGGLGLPLRPQLDPV